ncbi:MAG: acyl-CoA dehydrogenase [Luteitalea sp.]|nr:acyl-CoA dehydrogenase [Luteitalea sp.]
MYRLSAEQQAFVDRVRVLAEAEIRPHAERVDEQSSFPKEALAALGRAGYLGLTIAPEHGGLGQGLRVACAVLEELAQRCASTAMVSLMHLCGIACYGTATNKTADLLRAAAKGEHLSTLAFSEPGSRSHFWSPVSQVVATNRHVRLSAEKSWVTSAGVADGYVVSSRCMSATNPTDTILYLALRGDEGIDVTGPWHGLGLRGNASAPMTLRNVAFDERRALCAPGQGLEMMLTVVLPVFLLGSAAIAVGLAEAAVAATQQHLTAKRLEHLGQSLADIPTLRARLAQMRIETDRARAHLASVIDAVEQPGPMTQLLILESKAAAAETAVAVTETGMRACGGAAFSKHLGLERLFRDARAGIVMAPTTDQLHDFIGRALCGMEPFQ